ncbi:MAG: hypothetical protein K0S56_1417 [Microvirga sp.]|jgi:hypothetical protein|nr:hypothetical protein [Microvirga sp.]
MLRSEGLAGFHPGSSIKVEHCLPSPGGSGTDSNGELAGLDALDSTGSQQKPVLQRARGANASSQAEHADPLAGFIFHDFAPVAPPKLLVKGLVPFEGICFLAGQSGSGKTFLAVDLAVSLAAGLPFFGRKVSERVGVVILAAEGESTMALRVHAACVHKSLNMPLPLSWQGDVPNLAASREIDEMVGRLRAVDERFQQEHDVRLGCVVIDTLAAAFGLEDENNNAEASKIIRLMSRMAAALNAVVMPIHHYGKSAETGLRGASAWRAGADAVLAVTADRDELTGECANRRVALTKSRVGEEGWGCGFGLTFVRMGTDEDGDPYGACYVDPEMSTEGKILRMPKAAKMPVAAATFVKAMETAVIERGRKLRPFGSEGSEVVAVDREAVRAEFNPAWPADGDSEEKKADARRKAFKRGEEWARMNGRIATHEMNGVQMV